MPRGAWSKKDERQYAHILTSCASRGRGLQTCKRIAAATVNKRRSAEGRTLGGLEGAALEHEANARRAYGEALKRVGLKPEDVSAGIFGISSRPLPSCMRVLEAYRSAVEALVEARHAGNRELTETVFGLRTLLSDGLEKCIAPPPPPSRPARIGFQGLKPRRR